MVCPTIVHGLATADLCPAVVVVIAMALSTLVVIITAMVICNQRLLINDRHG